MSGGSYNYLFHKAEAGLLGEAIDQTQLVEMAERLEGLPWATVAARDVRLIIERARALDEDLRRLADAFHAIEWWDSCDWAESDARPVVEGYQPGPQALGVSALLAVWDEFDLSDYADDTEAVAALVDLVEPWIESLRTPEPTTP